MLGRGINSDGSVREFLKFKTIDIVFEYFLLMVKLETWNSHMLNVLFFQDVDDV